MASQAVKVKRETLEACMTCPLCNKLLKEATTISLCLHTFCRRCVYEKLSEEGMDCCPVCDIELGALPVDKLRPDHNLQDIRSKIFPFKRRKITAPEVMPSISPPAKRKERSLSSLVVSTPKVSMQTGLTGRRTKASTRRAAALRGCNFSVQETPKKEESEEENPSSSGSPDCSNKSTERQVKKARDSSMAHPSSEQRTNEDAGSEILESKADLWTPLNCLVEAANRTKSSKSTSQGLNLRKLFSDDHLFMSGNKVDREFPDASNMEVYTSKGKEHGENTSVQDEKSRMNLLPRPVKRRRVRAAAQKKAAASEEQSASAQALLDAFGAKYNRRDSPIWFSLVASEDQRGDASLPQISACYLRIKDGKMPVSFIQKYLVKKLDLSSEAEVEIMCRGRPVVPNLQLHNLVDLWFRTASTSKKVPASVGSSAKDFVMVLSYCRKVQAS